MVGQKIIKAIKENLISCNKKIDDVNICNPMKITGNKMKHNEHKDGVIWSSPPLGWLKANFDGSTKGNPGRARCGGVLREHYWRVVGVVVITIGHLTSHKVEAIASLYTVRIVVEIVYQNLWPEGNSLNIINMLNNKNMVTWNIEGSILEIKNMIKFFDNVIISHNYWEGKKVANWIVNKAVKVDEKLTWTNYLNKEREIIVWHDYCNRRKDYVIFCGLMWQVVALIWTIIISRGSTFS